MLKVIYENETYEFVKYDTPKNGDYYLAVYNKGNILEWIGDISKVVYAVFKKVETKRYFIVYFRIRIPDGTYLNSMSRSLSFKNFPNRSILKKVLTKAYNIGSIAIDNIFEFKSEQDYLDYKEK